MAGLSSGSADRGPLPHLSASSLTYPTFTHAHNAQLILAHQQRQARVACNSISARSAAKRRILSLVLLHLSSCELDHSIDHY